MAVTFVCGAECHTSSAPRHWDNVGGSGGFALEATTFHTETGSNGIYAYRANFSGGASDTYFTHNHSGASRHAPCRAYMYFVQFPNATVALLEVRNSAGTSISRIRMDSAGKVFTTSISGASTVNGTTTQLSTNAWYCIEMLADFNSGVTTDGRVNTNVMGQSTTGATTRNTDGYRIGPQGASTTIDVIYDDIVIGDVSADYPIGLGWVNRQVPNADGTHNLTGNNFRYTDTSVISGSATDVYTYVDDSPDNNTDYVYQAAVATTEYLEIKFPATGITNIIKSVCAVFRYQTSSAANANWSWKINDGGTTADIFSGTTNSTGGLVLYKMFTTKPSDSLAWTNAALSALRVRMGYSSDVSPLTRSQSVMFEVDYRSDVEAHGGLTQVIMLG